MSNTSQTVVSLLLVVRVAVSLYSEWDSKFGIMSRKYCSFNNHGKLSFLFLINQQLISYWRMFTWLLPCKTYIKFLFKAVVRFRGNFTL